VGIYLLIAAGVLFAALFALNNLLKTIFRRNKIGFLDLLLAFMTTLVLLAGLIGAQLRTDLDTRVTWVALAAGGGLLVFSLLITLLEVFRAQRLRGSRGILGLYSGLLVMVAFFAVPLTAAYLVEPTPTVVVQAVSSGQGTEEADGLNAEQQQRAEALFEAITKAVTDEIDVDPSVITDALQNGTPLATLIEENGGSVDNVVKAISEIMRAGVRESAARGEINPIQSALALSQMENFVRFAMNSDLYVLAQQVGGATPDPNATRANLFAFATGEPTNEATETATPTASSTPAPTETRRPSSTPRPTRTPYTFSTRTPTPTPTLVTPCVASVEYNLRLRSAPNRDSETLLVIPYQTTIELYGKGEPSENDARWWYTQYEGQQGWVDGQYMIVSSACENLPLRDAN
jgi:hypothetical protein